MNKLNDHFEFKEQKNEELESKEDETSTQEAQENEYNEKINKIEDDINKIKNESNDFSKEIDDLFNSNKANQDSSQTPKSAKKEKKKESENNGKNKMSTKKTYDMIYTKILTLLFKPENKNFIKLIVYLWSMESLRYPIVSLMCMEFCKEDPELKKLYNKKSVNRKKVKEELIEQISQIYDILENKIKESSEYYKFVLSKCFLVKLNKRIQT